MWKKGIYFLGGLAAAPLVKPLLRPIAREAMKGGLLLGGFFHRIAEEAKENVDDLRAEARAGLGSRFDASKKDAPAGST